MEMIIKKLNSLKGVKVSGKMNVLKLFHVEVNGQKVLSFRVNKQSNQITVFPYWKHFSNTQILTTNEKGLLEVIFQCL